MDSVINNINRLTEQEIKILLKTFENRYKKAFVPGNTVRLASVLVPMFIKNDEWHLLYTRRTDTLQFHKGQVSFPGGVCDPRDESSKATALRESYEEISLNPDFIKFLVVYLPIHP